MLVGVLVALAAPAAAVSVPGTRELVRASGWIDGLAVVGPDAEGPRQRPQATAAVRFDAAPSRWLRLHTELRGRVGGPFEGGQGAGYYDFGRTWQNTSPALDFNEAWLELRRRSLEVRVGIQKVAWGKLDGIPPTDVVNPRDFHDPIVQDFEERKIGIPMLLGTWYPADAPAARLSDLRLSLLCVPFAVPSRLALLAERWFPRSIRVPDAVTVSERALAEAGYPIGSDLRIPFAVRTTNDVPPRAIDRAGVGLRAGGRWGRVDWDIYHYTGPETGPDLALETVLVRQGPVERLDIRGRSDITQVHDTIHMTGAAVALPLAGVTLRAEGAHFVDRPYLRRSSDLIAAATRPATIARLAPKLFGPAGRVKVPLGALFPDLDAVEWGIGADYLWRGWQPIVQVNQIVLLDPAPRMIIADPETRLSGSVSRRFLDERLEVEVRAVWAIEREAAFVFPRLAWRLAGEALRLRLGYLWIDGPAASIIGQYRHNDEVVLDARWSF